MSETLVLRSEQDTRARIREAVDALYAADAGQLRTDQARDAAQRLECLLEDLCPYEVT